MKDIPIQLLNHYRSGATTWCFLMKVKIVKGKHAGLVLGFSGMDSTFEYDDGEGAVLYRSDNGFTPAKFQKEAEFNVDNTEVQGWIQDEYLTERDILGGVFDSAEVTIYRVNYMDLTQGHEVVDYGNFGVTEFHDNGSWNCHFRSLMQQAKQPIDIVYSLTCRNKFGDHRCKVPLVWHEGTVFAVGEENLLIFRDPALPHIAELFAPGVVKWVTGNNVGVESEVFNYSTQGQIQLSLETPLPIKEGDTFLIRSDCAKDFESCKRRNNVLWFRGEHLTPVEDTGLSVPGAYISRENAS